MISGIITGIIVAIVLTGVLGFLSGLLSKPKTHIYRPAEVGPFSALANFPKKTPMQVKKIDLQTNFMANSDN